LAFRLVSYTWFQSRCRDSICSKLSDYIKQYEWLGEFQSRCRDSIC